MRSLKYQPATWTLATVALAATSLFGYAQEISFEDLDKKLTYDRSPVETVNGIVASYAPILEDATPAVVTVFAKDDPDPVQSQPLDPREEMLRRLLGMPGGPNGGGGRGGRPPQSGLGSGVIISADGYILTNNHVVSGADRITVRLKDSRKEYTAELIGADPDTDVAMIKIDAQGLTPIKIGDSSNVKVGDVVLAVGNPLGLEQTVTQGIVSALGRRSLDITSGGYENFIQTDASINVGNSGGALIDAQGRLVGLNTAIKTADFSRGNVGIAFAIPSNMALSVVQKLLDGGGTVRRGFLGVMLGDLTDEKAAELGRNNLKGAWVRTVNEDTPADVAGLKENDLVTAINGKSVFDAAQLRLEIGSKNPGDEVRFSVVRDRKAREISVVLGDKDELMAQIEERRRDPRAQRRGVPGYRRGDSEDEYEAPEAVSDGDSFIDGVEIQELDTAMREALGANATLQGVVVSSVAEGSAAEKAGIREGQIITLVDQERVRSVEEAQEVLRQFDGQYILIQVRANGKSAIKVVDMSE